MNDFSYVATLIPLMGKRQKCEWKNRKKGCERNGVVGVESLILKRWVQHLFSHSTTDCKICSACSLVFTCLPAKIC